MFFFGSVFHHKFARLTKYRRVTIRVCTKHPEKVQLIKNVFFFWLTFGQKKYAIYFREKRKKYCCYREKKERKKNGLQREFKPKFKVRQQQKV